MNSKKDALLRPQRLRGAEIGGKVTKSGDRNNRGESIEAKLNVKISSTEGREDTQFWKHLRELLRACSECISFPEEQVHSEKMSVGAQPIDIEAWEIVKDEILTRTMNTS